MDKGGAQREKLVSSDGRVDGQPSKASGKHHQSLLLEHALCFRYFVKSVSHSHNSDSKQES